MGQSLGIIMYINTLNRQYFACIDFVIMIIIYIQNILVPNRICQNVSIFDPERHKTKSNCRENFSHCVCSLLSVSVRTCAVFWLYLYPALPGALNIWCWPLTLGVIPSSLDIRIYQFSHFHPHWQWRWDNWNWIIARMETIAQPLAALMMFWL